MNINNSMQIRYEKRLFEVSAEKIIFCMNNVIRKTVPARLQCIDKKQLRIPEIQSRTIK